MLCPQGDSRGDGNDNNDDDSVVTDDGDEEAEGTAVDDRNNGELLQGMSLNLHPIVQPIMSQVMTRSHLHHISRLGTALV